MMKNISKHKLSLNRSKIYSKHGLKTVYVSKSGFTIVISNKTIHGLLRENDN